MESMTQPCSESNRDALECALNDLKAYVERSAQQGVAAHEVEAGIWHRVLQLGRQALGLLFRLVGPGDGERPSYRPMDTPSVVWRRLMLGCISRSLVDSSWSGWSMAPAKGKRLPTCLLIGS